MLPIFETKSVTVGTLKKPHHARSNGGQLVLFPKTDVEHHYEMPLDVADNLMHMGMIAGEAATSVMRRNGLDVVRLNYQDNGNWAYKPGAEFPPHPHLHIFLRTSHEKHPDNDPRFQAFPDAVSMPAKETGYYDKFDALTEQDCIDIHDEIVRLLETEKYKPLNIVEAAGTKLVSK